MKEQEVILSRLLDRFETSKHLLEPGVSKRRVMLRIERKELPEYRYDQSAELRDAWNAAAETLQEQGIVTIEWARPKLMGVLNLNLEKTEEAYQLCGRVHPRARAEAFIKTVEEMLSSVRSAWIISWKEEVCDKARNTFHIPGFCQTDFTLLDLLLRAFKVYDGLNGAPVSQRAFSIACFHDSKTFEREVRDEFLRIATRFDPEFTEMNGTREISAREKLAMLGIYVRPELFELCGDCAIRTETGRLEIAAMGNSGIGVAGTAVENIRTFELDHIHCITFIENKTNYDEYLITEKKEDELVLYHGGILSPQRKAFFEKLAKSVTTEQSVQFWADIDLGGFLMFERLKTIFPTLRPMRMAAENVRIHREHGLMREKAYLTRLQEEIEKGRFPEFRETIAEILSCGVTIEQESFLM